MNRKEQRKIDLMTGYALDLMGLYDNPPENMKEIKERVRQNIVNIIINEIKREYNPGSD